MECANFSVKKHQLYVIFDFFCYLCLDTWRYSLQDMPVSMANKTIQTRILSYFPFIAILSYSKSAAKVAVFLIYAST